MATIVPEGQEAPKKNGTPLEIVDAKKTTMVAKAKELLTEPMSDEHLMDVLEHWYVYGKVLTGEVSGNYTVAEGHVSEHYTSKQLKEVVDQVQLDLTPQDELTPNPEV